MRPGFSFSHFRITMSRTVQARTAWAKPASLADETRILGERKGEAIGEESGGMGSDGEFKGKKDVLTRLTNPNRYTGVQRFVHTRRATLGGQSDAKAKLDAWRRKRREAAAAELKEMSERVGSEDAVVASGSEEKDVAASSLGATKPVRSSEDRKSWDGTLLKLRELARGRDAAPSTSSSSDSGKNEKKEGSSTENPRKERTELFTRSKHAPRRRMTMHGTRPKLDAWRRRRAAKSSSHAVAQSKPGAKDASESRPKTSHGRRKAEPMGREQVSMSMDDFSTAGLKPRRKSGGLGLTSLLDEVNAVSKSVSVLQNKKRGQAKSGSKQGSNFGNAKTVRMGPPSRKAVGGIRKGAFSIGKDKENGARDLDETIAM